LVKASKQNRAHHYSRIKAHGCQKSAALQCYVRCTHNKGLAWWLGHRKDVIACYAEFLVTWDAWILRPATNCYYDCLSSYRLFDSLGVLKLNCVLVYERCISVEVLNLKFYDVGLVTPVERLHVFLDILNHCGPLRLLIVIDRPTLGFHVTSGLGEEGCVVHHLFWDTADVDASAANSP